MEIRFKCKKCNKENIIEVDDEIDITGNKNLLTELLIADKTNKNTHNKINHSAIFLIPLFKFKSSLIYIF